MTNYEYLVTMNRLTNEYNKQDNTLICNQEKYKILFSILSTMYNNFFNKQINGGVLAQIIVGQSTKGLIEQAFFNGNEKIIFDSKKNTLKLGNILQVSINSECPRFMQEEMVVGDAIDLKITNPSGECIEQLFLCTNENELWIEYDSSQYTGTINANSIYIAPHQFKTYEKRIFDSFGIEVEREINTVFRFGISAIPMFTTNDRAITELETIRNKTKITRDPSYFMIAKIEMVQRNTIYGEYSVIQSKQQQYQSKRGTTFLKETYGLCPYGQSLDVNLCLDVYDEAIEHCKSPTYLNVGGDINDKRFVKTNPKLNFIPRMNHEIIRRIQNAITNYNISGRKQN